MKNTFKLPVLFFLKTFFKPSLSLVIVMAATYSSTAQNIITNGDFESGGSGVGFTSNYNLASGNTTNPQNYAIVSNPSTINPGFSSACVDHTSGTGKMLVADGANGSQNKIWEQVPGGGFQVQSGRTYTFSYWVQSISDLNVGASIPDIEVRINNVVQTPVSGSTVVPTTLCQWTKVTYSWTAPSNYAQIWLFDKTTASIGNDFAIDDLSFTLDLGPLTIGYTGVNPVCFGSTDGGISITATGGTPPYTYSLNGGPFVSNNGFFAVGPSTGNTVAVRDAASPTPATVNGTTTIDIIAPANPLTVSNDTTICTGGTASLLASGGTTYSWLPVTDLSAANIPNPIATPASTRTYTVTAQTTSNNLIANGDFESGNSGFLTDYIYYTNTTNQKAYGINSNPQDFDINFTNCADHTSANGTGKMMIVDGSPTTSDRVWCQTVPVQPSTTYTFSYWIQTVALPSPAQLETQVNGTPITGVAVSSTSTAPANICGWVQVAYTWNSGTSTSAQICIYDRNGTATGNDVALDDISFTTNCSVTKSITVTVSNITAAPTATSPVNYCQNATAVALTASGNNLLWYDAATGGTGSTIAPVPSTSTVGSTTYYVSQTADCGESGRTPVVVNIAATTAAPTVTSPVNYCQNSTAVPLSATGTGLLWYDAATGGTGSATAPTPLTTSAGSITYYVSQAGDCGESQRAPVVVNVTATPSAPSVSSPVKYCLNTTASLLTATGSGLLWYTTATGGTGTTTAPTPLTTTAGSTTYYVSETTGTCEGPRSSIVVDVTNIPLAPVVNSPLNYCQNTEVAALTATGTNLLWYDAATGGTGSSTAPTPSTANTGSITYYVSQSTGTCEGPRAAITVNVNSGTAAPTATSPVNYCQGATAVPLTATGNGLLWYANATGGTGSTTAPTPPTVATGSFNYYVSQSGGCGESERIAVTVTINPKPVVNAGNDVTIASGATALLTGVSSEVGTYLWTPSNLVSTPASLSTPAAPTETTTFTLTVTTSAGCITADQVLVTVETFNCGDLNIPNAFTPNNDGYFDLWNIAKPECALKLDVAVYNRWGSEVYRSADYQNNWNGSYKGKPLPDGTYYYIVKTIFRNSDKVQVRKGNLTIIR